MSNRFNELWVEKYRPKNLDEYVFDNSSHKKSFSAFLNDKSIPHLLLAGLQGSGKSSIAKILIDGIGIDDSDFLYLNASDSNSVDDMRSTIKNFAMTCAYGELGIKVILLEEGDQLTPAAQGILRRLMEDYSDTVRFVLTANNIHRITAPIVSRCQVFTFKAADQDDITEHVAKILIEENIQFSIDDLDVYVRAAYPDIRKIINDIQQNCVDRKLVSAISSIESGEDYNVNLLSYISNDEWQQARKVVCKNITTDSFEHLYRFLYLNLEKSKKFSDVLKWEQGQLEIAEHLYMHSIVADPEINLAALFIKLKQI